MLTRGQKQWQAMLSDPEMMERKRQRNREYMAKRRAVNYEVELERQRKWVNENRERKQELSRNWYASVKDLPTFKERRKHFFIDPVKRKISANKYAVKASLAETIGVSINEVPVELLEAKNTQLNVIRLVKELMK